MVDFLDRVTPQQILAGINRPSDWTGRIHTLTGGFRPLEPRVQDVVPEDIIWGLAGTWRFGGGTYRRMTVAEHAVGVSRMIEILWGRKYAPAGLLHDGCEVYTHDLQSPMRCCVRVQLPSGEVIPWDEMDRRINVVVFERMGLDPSWLEHPQVRACDALSAVFEKKQSLSLSQTEDWGLPPIPPELADFAFEFWDPHTAAVQLKNRWVELGLPLTGAVIPGVA